MAGAFGDGEELSAALAGQAEGVWEILLHEPRRRADRQRALRICASSDHARRRRHRRKQCEGRGRHDRSVSGASGVLAQGCPGGVDLRRGARSLPHAEEPGTLQAGCAGHGVRQQQLQPLDDLSFTDGRGHGRREEPALRHCDGRARRFWRLPRRVVPRARLPARPPQLPEVPADHLLGRRRASLRQGLADRCRQQVPPVRQGERQELLPGDPARRYGRSCRYRRRFGPASISRGLPKSKSASGSERPTSCLAFSRASTATRP